MNYKQFNKDILNFYVERANSAFCNLAIDEYDIKDLVPELPIFGELKQNWSNLLEKTDNIPQYFEFPLVIHLDLSANQIIA